MVTCVRLTFSNVLRSLVKGNELAMAENRLNARANDEKCISTLEY